MARNIVLSYHDSCLYQQDVELLKEGQWLNDKIIGFCLEYLEHSALKGRNDVALVTPDVIPLVAFSSVDELKMMLGGLDLPSRELVLFVINDNMENAAGGSHWSLLCYVRSSNCFYHFDSANHSNAAATWSMTEKLTALLGCSSPPDAIDVKCPAQQNCSDCGVYAVYYAEAIVNQYVHPNDANPDQRIPARKVDFPDPRTIRAKRQAVRQCIQELARKTPASG